MHKQKARATSSSNISYDPSRENKHVTPLKARSNWGRRCIYEMYRTHRQQDLLFCNSVSVSESVEIRQRSVFIDVICTEHSMMQMKTTDDMGKITLYLLIVTETLSLDHSVDKNAQTV